MMLKWIRPVVMSVLELYSKLRWMTSFIKYLMIAFKLTIKIMMSASFPASQSSVNHWESILLCPKVFLKVPFSSLFLKL